MTSKKATSKKWNKSNWRNYSIHLFQSVIMSKCWLAEEAGESASVFAATADVVVRGFSVAAVSAGTDSEFALAAADNPKSLTRSIALIRVVRAVEEAGIGWRAQRGRRRMSWGGHWWRAPWVSARREPCSEALVPGRSGSATRHHCEERNGICYNGNVERKPDFRHPGCTLTMKLSMHITLWFPKDLRL